MSVLSSVSTAPTHCVLWTFKNTQMRGFTAVELALCRDHYIFTSCHCYHGKERKSSVYRTSTAAISLRCLHISWLPWRPAEWAWLHCASDMPEGATWCAFLPHYGFHSAVSEALNFSINELLAWLSSTCRGMCKHTEHKVWPRREIPASGVRWISTLTEVLIAKCHSKAFLIARHHHCVLTHLLKSCNNICKTWHISLTDILKCCYSVVLCSWMANVLQSGMNVVICMTQLHSPTQFFSQRTKLVAPKSKSPIRSNPSPWYWQPGERSSLLEVSHWINVPLIYWLGGKSWPDRPHHWSSHGGCPWCWIPASAFSN